MKTVILCAALAAACAILAIRQIIIKKELKSIADQLGDILGSDTNTVISFGTKAKPLGRIVSLLNSKLADMRKKELAINSKNTEISTAITGISHDLRTPLTAIDGYLELIKKSTDNAEKEKYIEIISERTEAMKALTGELFRYSVVLADEELAFTQVCLNSALEKALAAGFSLLCENSITPQITVSPVRQERRLDEKALSRILGNIISNAARHSDGDLTVSLDENGVFTFVNSARELDEIQASRLFDRFYTVSNARGSTGLGLSIAKHLTEKMNGEISASFSDGKLTITLSFNR